MKGKMLPLTTIQIQGVTTIIGFIFTDVMYVPSSKSQVVSSPRSRRPRNKSHGVKSFSVLTSYDD